MLCTVLYSLLTLYYIYLWSSIRELSCNLCNHRHWICTLLLLRRTTTTFWCQQRRLLCKIKTPSDPCSENPEMHVVALISPYTQISATLHLLPSVFSIFAALRCALLLKPYFTYVTRIVLELKAFFLLCRHTHSSDDRSHLSYFDYVVKNKKHDY